MIILGCIFGELLLMCLFKLILSLNADKKEKEKQELIKKYGYRAITEIII